MLLTLCGCCCGGFTYLAYLGYKYYIGDMSLSKAGIKSSDLSIKKGPKVQSSRISKNEEEEGVSL